MVASILHLPGGMGMPETPFGAVVQGLEALILYRPGMREPMPEEWTPFVAVKGNIGVRVVAPALLDAVKEVLLEYGVDLVEPPRYALCCAAAEEKTQALSFLNAPGEPMLLLAPSTPWHEVLLKAYFTTWGPSDEELEKRHVRENGAYFEHKLFPSIDEACAHIKATTTARLKDCVSKHKGTRVAYLSGDPEQRYPPGASLKGDGVMELGWTPPDLARVYSDGSVLVAGSCYEAPLEAAFNPCVGFAEYTLGSCSDCYPRIREHARELALQRLDGKAPWPLLSSVDERLLQQLDRDRVRVRIARRKTLPLATSSAELPSGIGLSYVMATRTA